MGKIIQKPSFNRYKASDRIMTGEPGGCRPFIIAIIFEKTLEE